MGRIVGVSVWWGSSTFSASVSRLSEQIFFIYTQAGASRGKIHVDTVISFDCTENLDQNVPETGVGIPSEVGCAGGVWVRGTPW